MDRLEQMSAKSAEATRQAIDRTCDLLRERGATWVEQQEVIALIMRATHAAEDRAAEVVHRAYSRIALRRAA